ncbi:glycosyltransferase family 2 protein [Geojedonia litorea]|uniref:Glycosyltransferase family 2 protein n=1 Tax=Geojedonia litorea TaxID=1268269 RepID=A0ABV9MZQ1_9FLAO
MNLSSKNPFFSIITPLYNKEDYIENTLKSVLNQSFKDFEIIIIDDGSTDKSLKIVSQFKDQRIIKIKQDNKGISTARNIGINHAKGDYIAFLDADDLWKTDFLDSIYELITIYKDSLFFATGYASFYDGQKLNLNSNVIQPNQNELVTNYFERQKNLYASSSFACHKSVFDTIGLFNEKVNYGEEEDFAIRCFLKHPLAYCKTTKAYRLDGVENQLTAPNINNKRIIPDYDTFLIDNPNINLKKYIDFIHYKLVLLFKMERNYRLVEFYKKKINVNHLSLIQKFKFYLPIRIFLIAKTTYVWLVKQFVRV